MRLGIGVLIVALSCSATAGAAPEAWPEVERLFEYNRGVPLSAQDRVIEDTASFQVRDLTYASPRSGRVTAYLVVPKGKGPFPAILFGHWGCGTRTEFLAEARLYARSKVVSLLVDYPWVRPSPWRGSLEYVANPEGDRELYVQAVIDLRRGIDLLESLPYVDRFRIAYIGHSYGAQWGAILSAVDKRLRAAVLIGGVGASADIWLDSDDPEFAELRKSVAKEQMDRFIEVMRVLDGIRYVPHANPVPLLFQFARYERYFGEASMQRYADAASEPKLVLWYGTGHEINDPKALSDRGDWLRRILRFRK